MSSQVTFISAGAGSGKTHRLTELLFEKLSSKAARPAGVIATTFTVRAATELRERVRSSLIRNGALPLANAIGQARIGTVHSVCSGLLERFAFEAGISPDLRIIDEAQSGRMLNEAIDEVVTETVTRRLNALARRFEFDFGSWQYGIKTLIDQARANAVSASALKDCGDRNAKDLLSHFPKATRSDLNAMLKSALESQIPALVEGAKVKNTKTTAKYLELANGVLDALAQDRLTWARWVKLSKAEPEAKLRALAAPIGKVAERYAEHPGLRSDIETHLHDLFGLAAEALDAYEQLKREQGTIDFGDQESLTLRVLDHPAVQSALSEELDLLLVDEFQDTSPIQLALFMKLSALAKETYWVGDLKQAIYGFRGSDTELMSSVLRLLPQSGGKTEILDESRRSTPALVRFVNSVFVPAFAETLDSKSVELRPVREDLKSSAAVGNWILQGNNQVEQAAALASGILKLVESRQLIYDKEAEEVRPLRFADIAILARTNDRVLTIAAALDQMDIPCSTSQPGLLAKPETVLALACLRRVSDPSDTIATAEILSLACCEEPEEWLASRLKYLTGGGDADAWRESGNDTHPLIANLAALRPTLQLLSPREALQQTIVRADLPRLVLQWNASPDIGRRRQANLESLLDKASEFEDSCRSLREPATIAGLLLWLQDQAENRQDALAEPSIDAVRVLTYHGSKGLEWPVVVLADLEGDIKDRLWAVTAGSDQALDASDPLRGRYIRYWPWPFGKQRQLPLATQIAASTTGRVFRVAAEDEQKRLLYVAMTRARDLLVLTKPEKSRQDDALAVLQADWMISDANKAKLALPDGSTILSFFEVLQLPTEQRSVGKARKPLRWFPAGERVKNPLPMVLLPAQSEPVECEVTETAIVADAMKLKAKADPVDVGVALHACIAASFTRWQSAFSVERASALISNLDLAEVLNATEVTQQLEALHRWIESRWLGASVLAEVPVEQAMPSGQILKGQIDLLIRTPAGWIVLDHKAVRPTDGWQKAAADYSGQLAAYGNAVQQATGQPVLEYWLYSPLAGSAARVKLQKPNTTLRDVA